MYSYMLQAAEERLPKIRAKSSKEETGPSSSASAMDTDDLPLTALPLSPTSSTCTTMPPPPSSLPPTAIPINITKEVSLPYFPQNPCPPMTSITLSRDTAVVIIVTAFPILPTLLEMSHSAFPTETITGASSSPVPSADLDTPSTSSTPNSAPSFSFALDISVKDDIPSTIVPWSSPPSPASILPKADILPPSPLV